MAEDIAKVQQKTAGIEAKALLTFAVDHGWGPTC